MENIREQAERLYKKVNTFILSCVGADGYPMTKAVVPANHREDLNELYFCTNTSSNFAAAISANPKGSVYFYSRGIIWKGCMLKGDFKIVTDMATKEKYWQEKFKNAYPQKSYTDPDFCVVKFVSLRGRFYSLFKPSNFDL
jgi:general stress protein 26